MNYRSLWHRLARIGLLGGACLAVLAGEALAQVTVREPTRPTPRIRAAVTKGIVYDPAVRERALAAVNAEGPDVVSMERYVLSEARLSRSLDEALGTQKRNAEMRFTPQDGGAFWRGRVDGRPAAVGMVKWEELLEEDAKFDSEPPMPWWDFLKLKL